MQHSFRLLATLALLALVQCKPDHYLFVTAASGLILRTEPSQSSRAIATIPFATRVTVLGSSGKTENIGGIRSEWIKVENGNDTGFVFGEYLSYIRPVTQAALVGTYSSVKDNQYPYASTLTLSADSGFSMQGNNCHGFSKIKGTYTLKIAPEGKGQAIDLTLSSIEGMTVRGVPPPIPFHVISEKQIDVWAPITENPLACEFRSNEVFIRD